MTYDLSEIEAFIASKEEWQQKFLNQLKLVYTNLRDNHPLKESMRKYIDYFENWEEKSWIKTNEAIRLYHILEDAWLIKDKSWEELWKQIQERETWEKITAEIVNFSGKVWDIVDGK